MSAGGGTYRIGPRNGRVIVHTGREGKAARVGHDLTITFGAWSGKVTLDGPDPEKAKVEATVELHSIEIRKGTGGVIALTDNDRREIRSTALRILAADQHPEAIFESTSIAADGDNATMDGTLTIHGRSAPVSFVVTLGDAWRARATVRQSSFGIKPYRAFLGALRLADEVRIEVEVSPPADA